MALERILVRICDGKLGDVLMATPTFVGLREAHPQAKITLLLRLPYPGDWIKRYHPWIDEIILEDRRKGMHGPLGVLRLLHRIRQGRFDAAVDLRLRSRYAWLYWAARIPIRSSTSTKYYKPLLTHNIPLDYETADRHEVEYNYALAAPLDVTGETGRMMMPLLPEEEREADSLLAANGIPPDERFVVVNPSHGGSSRALPPERFTVIAGRIAAVSGLRIVLIGGPDHCELNAGIATALPPNTVDLAGKTSIPVLAAVLKRCALHVSIDTGTSHLAGAMGAPCLTIFPFVEYWEQRIRWQPWKTAVRSIGPHKTCPSCLTGATFCLRKETVCIDSVSDDEAVAAAMELLLTETHPR